MTFYDDPVPRANILLPHLRIPERSTVVHSSDGVDVAVTDWGTGDPVDGYNRPILVMAHATGMHGHSWVPTVIALGDRFRCIAIDQRAQGDTSVPTAGGFDWSGVADDIEIAMGSLGLLGRPDVFGIGHSQGGFAVCEVERRRPGTFGGIFAWEPVIFPPMEPAQRAAQDNMMANLARKRRRSFPSWEAALENYRGKGPFAKVDDDLIRCYVYWGFDEQPDGTITLKCEPDNEAELFLNSYTDLFNNAETIRCPVTIALGSLTNDGFLNANPAFAKLLSNGELVRLEGRTHFGIYEGILEMADLVATSLLPTGDR